MKDLKDFVCAVDMDDTIEDLLTPWMIFLNSRYETTVEPKDVRQWDLSCYFPNLTPDQLYEPLRTPDFWKTVKPLPGAVECLQFLHNSGIQLYICTSTYYRNIMGKFDNALFNNFPFLTFRDVIISYRKQLINADVLVDDGIHNLIGGNYVKLLMDSYPNQDIKLPDDVYRVKNWNECIRTIDNVIADTTGKHIIF